MRTTLFVSALFAVSLTGGVALAEKPPVSPAKEPKVVVDKLRAHGDVVDKSYHAVDKASASRATDTSVKHPTKNPIDKSAARINCSESGTDCSAPKGAAK